MKDLRVAFAGGGNMARSLIGGGVGTASSIAASILAPIFSGGQLEGNLIQSNARKRELVATYKKTVLTAFGEVEDALTAARNNATRLGSHQSRKPVTKSTDAVSPASP